MEQNSAAAAIAPATSPRFAGHPVTLGGVAYVVPPLSLRAVRDLRPEMARIAQGVSDNPLEHLTDVAKVIHAALLRNYPDIQLEELTELIDMGNVGELLSAASGKMLQAPASLPVMARA